MHMRGMIAMVLVVSASVARAQDNSPSPEAQHTARLNAVKSDPKQMRVVFGAALCYCQRIRKDALGELAKEHRYSAQAGVANLDKRDQLKTRLQWVDTAESVYRAKLKKWKGLAPAPCGDATVKKIVECKVKGAESGLCADEIGLYAEFVDDAPGVDE